MTPEKLDEDPFYGIFEEPNSANDTTNDPETPSIKSTQHPYRASSETTMLPNPHETNPSPSQPPLARRPRCKNPMLALALWQNWTQSNPVPTSATHLITSLRAENPTASDSSDPPMWLWGTEEPFIKEIENMDAGRPVDHANLIKLLYWRARLQAQVWDVFQLLHDRGHLDLRRFLGEPVSFESITVDVSHINQYLRAFTQARDGDPGAVIEGWCGTAWHLMWLAIMIVRGAQGGDVGAVPDPEPDPEHGATGIWGTIMNSGLLGEPDATQFRNIRRRLQGKNWTVDPEAMSFPYSDVLFGWWLPMGPYAFSDDEERFHAQVVDIGRAAAEKCNRIEVVFKEMGNVPDQDLGAEHQLASYLGKRLHSEQNHMNSGEDVRSPPPSSSKETGASSSDDAGLTTGQR